MGDDGKKALADFDQLWNYNKPAETEQTFRALLPDAETSGDADYHAELLTQIARTLGLQQRFGEAHAVLDQVHAMLTDDAMRPRIRYLLERGRVLNSSGAPVQALPLFLEAWETARAAGEDFHAVDAAHMAAIVEKGDAALEWNRRAIEAAEISSQPRARKWGDVMLRSPSTTPVTGPAPIAAPPRPAVHISSATADPAAAATPSERVLAATLTFSAMRTPAVRPGGNAAHRSARP